MGRTVANLELVLIFLHVQNKAEALDMEKGLGAAVKIFYQFRSKIESLVLKRNIAHGHQRGPVKLVRSCTCRFSCQLPRFW
jgi:hypothetical protein